MMFKILLLVVSLSAALGAVKDDKNELNRLNGKYTVTKSTENEKSCTHMDCKKINQKMTSCNVTWINEHGSTEFRTINFVKDSCQIHKYDSNGNQDPPNNIVTIEKGGKCTQITVMKQHGEVSCQCLCKTSNGKEDNKENQKQNSNEKRESDSKENKENDSIKNQKKADEDVCTCPGLKDVPQGKCPRGDDNDTCN